MGDDALASEGRVYALAKKPADCKTETWWTAYVFQDEPEKVEVVRTTPKGVVVFTILGAERTRLRVSNDKIYAPTIDEVYQWMISRQKSAVADDAKYRLGTEEWQDV